MSRITEVGMALSLAVGIAGCERASNIPQNVPQAEVQANDDLYSFYNLPEFQGLLPNGLPVFPEGYYPLGAVKIESYDSFGDAQITLNETNGTDSLVMVVSNKRVGRPTEPAKGHVPQIETINGIRVTIDMNDNGQFSASWQEEMSTYQLTGSNYNDIRKTMLSMQVFKNEN